MELIGERVGNYIIERALKKGGMGAVYVAQHPALGKRVAVKFLDTQLDDSELSRRFLNEARITASLDHPNIIGIYDFGELNGRFYYVMDLLVGRDLSEYLASFRPTPEQAIDYLLQICRGLQAAHESGIVHRDLKPANIYVLPGPPEVLKLMDFGIAKVLAQDAAKTNYGQLLGTPAYMAPEQAMGDLSGICPQTDLYAVGAIGYELLSGRRPFEHTSPMMLLIAHIHEPLPPLQSFAPQVTPQLASLLERCLHKKPAERPKSAHELAAQLEELSSSGRLTKDLRGTSDRSSPTIQLRSAAQPKLNAATTRKNSLKTDSCLPPTERERADLQHQSVALPPFSNDKTELATDFIETIFETALSHGASSPKQPEQLSNCARSQRSTETVGVEASVCLDESDRSILKKLLQRMKRKGELPAFVVNVGEVNRKADFEGKYSAVQLSASILKDHALTAKLLRVVNTNHINRFGGKIYSVQQAIVILGFEQIRSLALSIAIFDKEKAGATAERASDSAVHSLVSAELARSLSKLVGLQNEEEATVSAMFCNLGRHLALVYLPEQYDRALERAEFDKIPLERAAEKEFGISFQKLGIGVAEQWHLPTQLIECMSAAPRIGAQLHTDELKLASLAHLSNSLCELVGTGMNSTDDPRLKQLLHSHENLIKLDANAIPDLLTRVEESFRSRYAVLLGTKAKNSRFLQKFPVFSHQKPTDQRDNKAPLPSACDVKARPARNAEVRPAAQPPKAIHTRETTRKAVQELILGAPARDAAPPLKPANSSQLGTQQPQSGSPSTAPSALQMSEVREFLIGKQQPQVALLHALKIFSEQLSLPRVIVLKPSADGSQLIVSEAVGEDSLALCAEVRFTLNPSRQASDVFSKAYNGRRDVFVRDSYSEKSGTQVPQRYYEVIGSPAFVILPAEDDRGHICLLLADVADADFLPRQEVLCQFDELKSLIAAAAAA